MLFTKQQITNIFLLIIFAITFSSCNEQEFYEKEFLEGVGVPDKEANQKPPTTGGPGNTVPPVINPPIGGGNPGVCGTGTLQNTSDTFTQNTAQEGKVDILWVMDNSGSMADEQAALARNFDVFIQDFLLRNIDFKMAITTTDPRNGRDGELIGNLTQLTSVAAQADEATFISDFKRLIKVGIRGHWSERGLRTSNSFLTKQAANFLREDAFLVVVYISDEEDSSRNSVQSYVDSLKAYKNNAGLLKAYSIVTQVRDPRRRWETIGTRYNEAASLTGGTSSDIQQDFHTTLTDIGGQILNLLDSFPLSGVPANTSISLTVNGVPLTSGWQYDAQTRVIKFDQNAVPNSGAVTIAYYQHCVGGS